MMAGIHISQGILAVEMLVARTEFCEILIGLVMRKSPMIVTPD